MDNSLCVLIRRPPYGEIHAAEGIRHAGGALAEGMQTRIVLIDDGVYVARDGQLMGGTAWIALAPALMKVIAKGARVFVHTPSAQARGLLQEEHFISGVEALDDDEFARMLAQSRSLMIY